MNDFSYEQYLTLIETIKNVLPLRDFSDIKATDERFFLLRHDVEFSIEKAYELAQVEHDRLGINSSYFFQIRNYTYNSLAFRNIQLIKKIHEMGHKIGLHVHTSGCRRRLDDVSTFIKNDVHLFQSALGLPIDRFSLHRPTNAQLAANIHIDGLINVYDKLFFHFHKNKSIPSPDVKYFADSEHQWKYGYPILTLEKPIKKIQLLIHPHSWSKQGLDCYHNFKELIKLKHSMMVQAMNEECRHFPIELLINEKI